MIKTLTGQNSYQLSKHLNDIKSKYLDDYDEFGLSNIDGDECSLADIQQALTAAPFLTAKSLVLLRSPSHNKEFVSNYEKILQNIPATTDVLIVEPTLDKRQSYFKYLQKNTEFLVCDNLDFNGLTNWAEEYVGKNNAHISKNDTHYLIERVGQNQQLLANEIDKLLIFDDHITTQSIDLLTEPVFQSTIFQLLDAAFSGKDKKSIELYEQQRALKIEPQQITSMLIWQMHIIAIIKAAKTRSIDEISRDTHINPFVLRKSSHIASSLPMDIFKQCISKLMNIDFKLKNTTVNADDMIQQYLLFLANAS